MRALSTVPVSGLSAGCDRGRGAGVTALAGEAEVPVRPGRRGLGSPGGARAGQAAQLGGPGDAVIAALTIADQFLLTLPIATPEPYHLRTHLLHGPRKQQARRRRPPATPLACPSRRTEHPPPAPPEAPFQCSSRGPPTS